jgi:hypothetical protein
MITDSIWDVFPTSITILPTYRCNAACEQCCFESNPDVVGRLSRSQLLDSIREAKAAFPALKMIVFSGGECFLLKQDLYDAIALAHELGLTTRCVTNAFWGKTQKNAEAVVAKLLAAGVTEINISTGRDHQRWVPFPSVETAASALVAAGIPALVTVEADGKDSDCVRAAAESKIFVELLKTHPALFRLQQNVWMPFNTAFDPTRTSADNASIYEGCQQLYTNMVITPHAKLSSCCGLTFEHIPEMKLGDISRGLRSLAESQLDDFLKVWLAVDGPGTIMTRLFGDDVRDELKTVNHICHACVLMYKHPDVRAALRERAPEFVNEVMARFNLQVVLKSREVASLQSFANRKNNPVMEVA